jgi:hypothetical protein
MITVHGFQSLIQVLRLNVGQVLRLNVGFKGKQYVLHTCTILAGCRIILYLYGIYHRVYLCSGTKFGFTFAHYNNILYDQFRSFLWYILLLIFIMQRLVTFCICMTLCYYMWADVCLDVELVPTLSALYYYVHVHVFCK